MKVSNKKNWIIQMGIITTLVAAPLVNASEVNVKKMADAIFSVIEADRAIYTQKVVQRLQNEEDVIAADEHWKEESALPLPAQMLRMGAERVSEKKSGFSYALLSSWAINKQNSPKTALEKKAMKAIEKDKKNYYGEEVLGKKKYFTAVYPDIAVSKACVNCHNDHIDSPKKDFKIGDTMGGLVIRIPIED
ncbi:Tll0287-like domain-containing protein [Aliikangiella sp. IMCC44359]|uniref:Tll0287-like domain-containing protein n=1 Tax=Aliikangiella sp. IMCC44359 TaxID=3459125 RepID=UPI00403B13D9